MLPVSLGNYLEQKLGPQTLQSNLGMSNRNRNKQNGILTIAAIDGLTFTFGLHRANEIISVSASITVQAARTYGCCRILRSRPLHWPPSPFRQRCKWRRPLPSLHQWPSMRRRWSVCVISLYRSLVVLVVALFFHCCYFRFRSATFSRMVCLD